MLQEICELLYLSAETRYDSFDDAEAMKEEEEHDFSLEEYVQIARELVQVTEIAERSEKMAFANDIQRLFVDLSAPYYPAKKPSLLHQIRYF